MKLAFEFDRTSCVLVKHNNPCGTAVAEDLPRAFELALSGDPVSAFGGILATNRAFDAATARAVVASGTFLEVVVAPSVEAEAVAELQKAKWGANVRVLDLGGAPSLASAEVYRAALPCREVGDSQSSSSSQGDSPLREAPPPAEGAEAQAEATRRDIWLINFADFDT